MSKKRLALEFDSNEDRDSFVGWFLIERVAVVRVLRKVCERFGDNDWEDELHLGDVIEKHLEPYLAKRRKP